MKLKLAYMALKAEDAADAAIEMAPKAIMETALLVVGWILLGGTPTACLWACVGIVSALSVISAVFVAAVVAIRLLGYDEIELERLGLA